MKKANALFIFSHVRTYGYTQLCKMNDENKKRRRLQFFFSRTRIIVQHRYTFIFIYVPIHDVWKASGRLAQGPP